MSSIMIGKLLIPYIYTMFFIINFLDLINFSGDRLTDFYFVQLYFVQVAGGGPGSLCN